MINRRKNGKISMISIYFFICLLKGKRIIRKLYQEEGDVFRNIKKKIKKRLVADLMKKKSKYSSFLPYF